MEEYKVTFVHPTTRATLEAEVDPNMTVNEAINALVAENFIEAPRPNSPYILGINGGNKIEGEQTLLSGGLREGSTVSIVEDSFAG